MRDVPTANCDQAGVCEALTRLTDIKSVCSNSGLVVHSTSTIKSAGNDDGAGQKNPSLTWDEQKFVHHDKICGFNEDIIAMNAGFTEPKGHRRVLPHEATISGSNVRDITTRHRGRLTNGMMYASASRVTIAHLAENCRKNVSVTRYSTGDHIMNQKGFPHQRRQLLFI